VRRGETREALNEVSFTVGRGEVHALLGPNGAGKTTLCRIISTVLLPSSGTVRVAGYDVAADPKAVRSRIGLSLGGDRGLYSRLSVLDNLLFWGSLHALSRRESLARADDLLNVVQLSDRRTSRVESLSRGMKQRVHLARALMTRPQLLILDEPTSGLDPVSAHKFRQLIYGLRKSDTSVLIASHDLKEVEELCDTATLMFEGRVVASASPKSLREAATEGAVLNADDVPDHVMEKVLKMTGVTAVHVGNGGIQLHVKTAEIGADISSLMLKAGVTNISLGRPSLEESYFSLIERAKGRSSQ
jgi:ABC-2 type transport system ATP-binding protein